MASVEKYLRIVESLRAERSEWDSEWDILRKLILPQHEASAKDYDPDARIHCEVANQACQKLASAHISYITPSDKPWFELKPRHLEATDAAQKWCSKATEIIIRDLADSNFYTEAHEMYLDRCALGTGALLCEMTDKRKLNFTYITCGTFATAENSYGVVDVLARWYKQSPDQLMQRFGKNGRLPSAKAQAAFEDDSKRYKEDFEVIHLTRPRDHYVPDRMREDEKNRPFESIYILKDDKTILEEGGFYEFPYLVTRFLKWGKGSYGCAPGYFIKPTIHKAMFYDRIMDNLAELAAYPRILELATQVGEIDFRAGGRTLVSPEAAQLGFPREWATQGNYNIGMDRLADKEQKIKEAFYVPMIEVISSQEKSNMTATEVIALENEKILAFSPSFTLLVSDYQNFFIRLYGLEAREGKLPPDAPEEMMVTDINGEPVAYAPPTVQFTGKIAVAFDRMQSEGMVTALNIVTQVAPIFPNMVEVFNQRKTAKYFARTAHFPEDCILSDTELAEIDKANAQAAQEERQMAMAQAGAATAKDAGAAANEFMNAGVV